MVYQKHNEHLQETLFEQKGILHETQQLPVPQSGRKRQGRDENEGVAKWFLSLFCHPFSYYLSFLFLLFPFTFSLGRDATAVKGGCGGTGR